MWVCIDDVNESKDLSMEGRQSIYSCVNGDMCQGYAPNISQEVMQSR